MNIIFLILILENIMNYFSTRLNFLFLLLFPCIMIASNSQQSDGYESDGDTPLHLSVIFNDKKSTRKLLKNGINPNVTNRLNETALHKAIYVSRIKIARELVQNGASLTVQDKDGRTPLDYLVYREIPGNQEEYFENTEAYYNPNEVREFLQKDAEKYQKSKLSVVTRSQHNNRK